MWSWKLCACSVMLLVVWVTAEQARGSGLAKDRSVWARRSFDLLRGRELCRRAIDPGLLRLLLASGRLSAETFCPDTLPLSGNGGRKGPRNPLPEHPGETTDGSPVCPGGREREMLRSLLLRRPPGASADSTFGWCEAETRRARLRRHFDPTRPLRVMSLPLRRVIWEKEIGLQFKSSAGKEPLERVKLQAILLVFFLGDKEKDSLWTEESHFSLTVSKGRWFKYMPVCIAGDSKYLVVELPAKARKWLYGKSFQLSVRIRPLTAEGNNGMLASHQTRIVREAGDYLESLPQRLLFGWDKHLYDRVPPVVLGLLVGGRNARASGCTVRGFGEPDNEGSFLKTRKKESGRMQSLGNMTDARLLPEHEAQLAKKPTRPYLSP